MIRNIPYPGGSTNINFALQDSLSKFQKYPISSGGSRVLVFMSDGHDYYFDIQNAKNLQDINVKIFAIGVGSSFNAKILSSIASAPELAFIASDYSDLSRIQDIFIKSICDEPITILANTEIDSDIVGLVPKYYEFSFNPMKNLRIIVNSHAKVQLYASVATKTPWQGTNSSNIGSHNGYTNDGSEEKVLTLKGSKSNNGKVYLTLISDSNSSFSLITNECAPKTCKEGSNETNILNCQGSNFALGLFVGLGIAVMIVAGVVGYIMWRRQKRGIGEYEGDMQKLARVEMI